jgi:hypothetical protein
MIKKRGESKSGHFFYYYYFIHCGVAVQQKQPQ